MFAYVTVGGLNEIQVYRTDDFSKVATIPVGKLPHGIWPSGDGTRVYVGLENEDRIAAIDTLTNKVIATSPIGQAAQAVVYVPDAIPMVAEHGNAAMTAMPIVPEQAGTENLQPLGVAAQSTQLWLAPPGRKAERAPTSVSLSEQGLVQVLEACGHRARSAKTLRAGAFDGGIGRRRPRAAAGLHDQSGRLGDRQRDWTDPSGRARRRQDPAPLSRNRARHRR